MKKILHVTFLLALAVLFSGCVATLALWSSTEPKVKLLEGKSKAVSKLFAKDKILAFAKSLKTTSQVQKDALAFVGEKFFYVLDLESSRNLYDSLHVRLEKAYEISQTKTKNELDVLVTNEEHEFEQNFCLLYKTSKADEIAKLKELGFVLQDDKSNLRDYDKFKKCFSIKGRYFAKNDRIKMDYQFGKPIKLSLYTLEYTSSSSSRPDLVEAVLMTPIALMLDAVFLAVVIPTNIIDSLNK